MSKDNYFKRAEGAYAIPRINGKTLLIEVPAEDIGKLEGAKEWQDLLPIIPGMFGIVTGKIDEDDATPSDALARELYEERNILKPASAFTNSLPTAEIEQVRAEGRLLFTVHGHQFPITADEVAFINNTSKTIEIADEALITALQDQEMKIRPAVHAILSLLYKQLAEGKGI